MAGRIPLLLALASAWLHATCSQVTLLQPTHSDDPQLGPAEGHPAAVTFDTVAGGFLSPSRPSQSPTPTPIVVGMAVHASEVVPSQPEGENAVIKPTPSLVAVAANVIPASPVPTLAHDLSSSEEEDEVVEEEDDVLVEALEGEDEVLVDDDLNLIDEDDSNSVEEAPNAGETVVDEAEAEEALNNSDGVNATVSSLNASHVDLNSSSDALSPVAQSNATAAAVNVEEEEVELQHKAVNATTSPATGALPPNATVSNNSSVNAVEETVAHNVSSNATIEAVAHVVPQSNATESVTEINVNSTLTSNASHAEAVAANVSDAVAALDGNVSIAAGPTASPLPYDEPHLPHVIDVRDRSTPVAVAPPPPLDVDHVHVDLTPSASLPPPPVAHNDSSDIMVMSVGPEGEVHVASNASVVEQSQHNATHIDDDAASHNASTLIDSNSTLALTALEPVFNASAVMLNVSAEAANASTPASQVPPPVNASTDFLNATTFNASTPDASVPNATTLDAAFLNATSDAPLPDSTSIVSPSSTSSLAPNASSITLKTSAIVSAGNSSSVGLNASSGSALPSNDSTPLPAAITSLPAAVAAACSCPCAKSSTLPDASLVHLISAVLDVMTVSLALAVWAVTTIWSAALPLRLLLRPVATVLGSFAYSTLDGIIASPAAHAFFEAYASSGAAAHISSAATSGSTVCNAAAAVLTRVYPPCEPHAPLIVAAAAASAIATPLVLLCLQVVLPIFCFVCCCGCICRTRAAASDASSTGNASLDAPNQLSALGLRRNYSSPAPDGDIAPSMLELISSPSSGDTPVPGSQQQQTRRASTQSDPKAMMSPFVPPPTGASSSAADAPVFQPYQPGSNKRAAARAPVPPPGMIPMGNPFESSAPPTSARGEAPPMFVVPGVASTAASAPTSARDGRPPLPEGKRGRRSKSGTAGRRRGGDADASGAHGESGVRMNGARRVKLVAKDGKMIPIQVADAHTMQTDSVHEHGASAMFHAATPAASASSSGPTSPWRSTDASSLNSSHAFAAPPLSTSQLFDGAPEATGVPPPTGHNGRPWDVSPAPVPVATSPASSMHSVEAFPIPQEQADAQEGVHDAQAEQLAEMMDSAPALDEQASQEQILQAFVQTVDWDSPLAQETWNYFVNEYVVTASGSAEAYESALAALDETTREEENRARQAWVTEQSAVYLYNQQLQQEQGQAPDENYDSVQQAQNEQSYQLPDGPDATQAQLVQGSEFAAYAAAPNTHEQTFEAPGGGYSDQQTADAAPGASPAHLTSEFGWGAPDEAQPVDTASTYAATDAPSASFA